MHENVGYTDHLEASVFGWLHFGLYCVCHVTGITDDWAPCCHVPGHVIFSQALYFLCLFLWKQYGQYLPKRSVCTKNGSDMVSTYQKVPCLVKWKSVLSQHNAVEWMSNFGYEPWKLSLAVNVNNFPDRRYSHFAKKKGKQIVKKNKKKKKKNYAKKKQKGEKTTKQTCVIKKIYIAVKKMLLSCSFRHKKKKKKKKEQQF